MATVQNEYFSIMLNCIIDRGAKFYNR